RSRSAATGQRLSEQPSELTDLSRPVCDISAAVGTAGTGRARYCRPVLLGRARELDELGRRVSGLRAGAGFATVGQGSAGIGKTAILDALTDAAAAQGVRALRSSGTERETELVFSGLAELLAPVLPLIDVLPGRQQQTLRASLSLEDAGSHSDIEV